MRGSPSTILAVSKVQERSPLVRVTCAGVEQFGLCAVDAGAKTASKTTRKSSIRAKEPVQDNVGNIIESESLPKDVAIEQEDLGIVELKLSKSPKEVCDSIFGL